MRPTATAVWLAGAVWLGSVTGARGLDLRPEAAAHGWFFGAEGKIEDTDLGAIGFSEIEPQPEIRGGVIVAGRHHVGASYLRIRREEQGTVTALVLGILQVEDDVAMDLAVDSVRAHYGYSVVANPTIDVEPFVELGYLREETDIVDRTAGLESRSEDSGIFPLFGVALVLGPESPIRPRVRAAGIATGQGHLVDVEGGVEARLGPAFAGLGYRHVDFLLRGDGDADVDLDGFYLEGGVKF